MTCIEMYGAQKAKGILSILKYQKFQAPTQNEMFCSKMIKCYKLKRNQMKSFKYM